MGQTNHPRRLLALDPGERRTGVAISDELGLFAHPRAALIRGRRDLVDEVLRIVEEEGIDEVVVGLPLSMSGRESEQTRRAREFTARLRSRLSIPVTEWDERLSSVQAARTVTGRERRSSGQLDSAAAAVILQAVLDSRRGGEA
ncbi:MAG: Holliday junction resolvase RuvX [Dehalococcoidia bacterium]|nr:Holliday junction resolvase RuvX [Dehalococcoidia bacterium]